MIDRPANAPDPGHPLLVAARYNDAESEDHDLSETLSKHGLELKDCLYIAEQRALRLVLIRSGRLDDVSKTESEPIPLSDDENAILELLVPLYIDAMFLGWRAQEIESAGTDIV